MMSFELAVNETPITKVSVIRKGAASAPPGYGNEEGWFVYEWNAWRVDPERPNAFNGIRHYAAGELVHRYADGAEELAIKVLTEYREVARPEQVLAGDL
jgi:hypothetical protein